jgi:TRAP-type mannitol/chloroaromatic compound transport system permease small subunit
MLRLADSLDMISRMTASVIRWLALMMVLVQFGIVVGRYVFGYNIIAVQESVLYMHATLFMLGAGYTLLVDKHVRVDVFYAKAASDPARIDIFGHVFLLIPSMLALLYWSWPSVRNSWKILEGPISVGGIEAVFLLKSLIPAFCILDVLQSLSLLIRLLLPVPGRPRHERISRSDHVHGADRGHPAGLSGSFSIAGVAVLRLSRLDAWGHGHVPDGGDRAAYLRPDFQSGADRHSPVRADGRGAGKKPHRRGTARHDGQAVRAIARGSGHLGRLVGALLAASTGIVGATVVAMGMIALPTMLRAGYDPRVASGIVCTAGTLGQIIPALDAVDHSRRCHVQRLSAGAVRTGQVLGRGACRSASSLPPPSFPASCWWCSTWSTSWCAAPAPAGHAARDTRPAKARPARNPGRNRAAGAADLRGSRAPFSAVSPPRPKPPPSAPSARLLMAGIRDWINPPDPLRRRGADPAGNTGRPVSGPLAAQRSRGVSNGRRRPLHRSDWHHRRVAVIAALYATIRNAVFTARSIQRSR